MDKLKKLLRADDTEERCGLILKRNRVIETDNVAEDKTKGFEIPAEDMVEHEKNMIGTWHTHPDGNSNLSSMDYYGFLQWPKLVHYVIGVDGVSKYKVVDGIIINED